MFRNIVSRLSFSPALVGQLSFYAKRLKKEQFTRRLGLIFTALALVVQSLAVFQAPEPANAANTNDFVYGGVTSVKQFLNLYDKNHANLKDIFNSFGITRAEIANTKYEVFTVGKKTSWGRHARSIDVGSRNITNSSGKTVETIYGRPMSKMYKRGEASKAIAFTGYSKKQGWFGIILDCGNLVTEKVPPPIDVCLLKTKKIVTIYSDQFDSKLHSKKKADCEPPIKVCQLSNYKIVEIAKKDYNSKKHSKDVKNCSKPIKVCNLSSYKIETILERDFNSKKHSKDVKNCSKPIKVCNISNYTIITILERDFDSKKHIKNPTAQNCKDPEVKVCRISDYKVITIKESAFNPSVHSKDIANCKPPVKDIKVCDLGTKNLITIKEDAFDPSRHSKDEKDCTLIPGKLDLSKSATNTTQGNANATTKVAKSDDRINYTLSVTNVGEDTIATTFEDHLGDVLEYATLVDNGGGAFNEKEKTIQWPEVQLAGGITETRTYTVKLLPAIPAAPVGVSDRTSYDCKMDNVFGNGVQVAVDCPGPKVIESVVEELPQTGPGENMTFAAIVLAVVTFFYYRSKQMNKEVRLIRRNLNTGAM